MPEKRPIVFIDTNILLDAYRARNDVGLHLIKRLDDVQEHLISSYQVEMEFKKNRHSAILEALTALRPPEQSVSAPAFLSQAKTVEIIGKNSDDTKKRIKGLKDRIENILANPVSHDPVYQVAQRLFSAQSSLNLLRSDKRKVSVRRRAWKRFVLGYPPRKKNHTSTGDGVNWEWMIDCVQNTNRDLIIVSRDTDYGCSLGGNSFANDWLVQELKERTKKTRRLQLTPKLSVALDALKVKVTKAEKEEEAQSFQKNMAYFREKLAGMTLNEDAVRRIQERLNHLTVSPEAIQRIQAVLGQYSSPPAISDPPVVDEEGEG